MSAGLDISHGEKTKAGARAKSASWFIAPIAYEDLAIIAGAYAIANHLMSAPLVTASICAGIVVSDFTLYGIGAGAHRLPWLNRKIANSQNHKFHGKLKRNLFELVALCRVVPGIVSAAFLACGAARVSLGRFILASLVISALYLPVILYLATSFGDALDDQVGLWAWPLLFIAISITTFVRRQVFAFTDQPAPAASVTTPEMLASHRLESVH